MRKKMLPFALDCMTTLFRLPIRSFGLAEPFSAASHQIQ